MDGLARALRGVHTTCLNVITGGFHPPVFFLFFFYENWQIGMCWFQADLHCFQQLQCSYSPTVFPHPVRHISLNIFKPTFQKYTLNRKSL